MRTAELQEAIDWLSGHPWSKAKRVLEYIHQLEHQAVQGWRDIASAPKDGTLILVCTYLDEGEYIGAVVMWWADSWASMGNMKIKNAAGFPITMIPLEDQPTHWMPLPTAPADRG